MDMTSKCMDSVFKRFEILPDFPEGEVFDPNKHEAVFMAPIPDKKDNTIIEVAQTGWKIGDRVLRAAKVGIVKNQAK